MDSDSTRRNRIIFALLIIAGFIVLTLALRDSDFGPVRFARGVVTAVVSPVQGAVVFVTSPIGNTFSNIRDFSSLRRTNDELSERVDQLEQENTRLGQLEDENERLRELLGQKERTTFATVPGHIISYGGPWGSTVVVDKGSDDGIERHMPVLSIGGVAGQVVDTASQTATIRLISDPRSGVGVEVERTKERGVLEGEVGGGTKLRFLPHTSGVRAGDIIITSGIGGVYPRGLEVGTVSEISQQSALLEAGVKVDPFVILDRVADVLVVLGDK